MKAQSSTNILDVAPQGVAGVGGSGVDSDDPNAEASNKRQVGNAYKSCSGDRCERGDARSVSDETAWNRANVEASPADSQISTPLYLLASEIVDIVELAEQYRKEERDAAEEGALIEASGYPDPQYERNGRY